MRSSSLRRSTVPCHQKRAALLDSRLTEARGPCARLQYQPALVPEHRGTTELQKALSALHSIKLIMKSEWTEFRYNALLELGIHRLEGLVKVPWRSIPHDTSATSDLLSRLDSLRCCFLPDSTLQLRRACLSSAFSSLASLAHGASRRTWQPSKQTLSGGQINPMPPTPFWPCSSLCRWTVPRSS